MVYARGGECSPVPPPLPWWNVEGGTQGTMVGGVHGSSSSTSSSRGMQAAAGEAEVEGEGPGEQQAPAVDRVCASGIAMLMCFGLEDLAVDCLKCLEHACTCSVEDWYWLAGALGDTSWGDSGLHLASRLGMVRVLEVLLDALGQEGEMLGCLERALETRDRQGRAPRHVVSAVGPGSALCAVLLQEAEDLVERAREGAEETDEEWCSEGGDEGHQSTGA